MSKYKITRNNGEVVDIYIVENIGFGGEQSVVIYESPGGSGGSVLATGRLNKVVKIDGKILSNAGSAEDIVGDIQEKCDLISQIRDAGEDIKLTSPITDNSVGKYIIKSFNYATITGKLRYVTFDMELIEYRQKGVKQAAVNLVNFQPTELLKDRYNLRRQLSE